MVMFQEIVMGKGHPKDQKMKMVLEDLATKKDGGVQEGMEIIGRFEETETDRGVMVKSGQEEKIESAVIFRREPISLERDLKMVKVGSNEDQDLLWDELKLGAEEAVQEEISMAEAKENLIENLDQTRRELTIYIYI